MHMPNLKLIHHAIFEIHSENKLWQRRWPYLSSNIAASDTKVIQP